MDIFQRIKQNPGPLGQFADYGEGYFIFPELEGEIGPRMKFRGQDVIVWSINNYLGLANHPEVRKADAEAAAQYGMAYPMGARAMTGQTKYHAQLENELAEFVGKEKAYLLNYGYQGMVSGIDALVSKNDVIVYDMESHACIVDGVRLHLGKRFTFKHNDIESLRKNLGRAEKIVQETGGGILVITEGVFGMMAEQGKIKEIAELKKEFNFRLLVDDAHGFGVLGEKGAGVGEAQDVMDEIDVYFSTFAKSMAGIGAFFAGDKEIIRYMQYNMRSQIFAKSLPMPMVLGALKRLEIIKKQPELKENLWHIVDLMQAGLREEGFNLGLTNTPVTPIILQGTPIEATIMAKDLRENYGIFVSVVVYPVIPKGTIIFRIMPTAAHTEEEVKITLEAFKSIREKLDSGVYKKEAEKLDLDYTQY
ncbi:MAG: aminotransferase class I/II-fold pyridoxal phosphate-dependent enzyme [Weeksellaceae bacterium]